MALKPPWDKYKCEVCGQQAWKQYRVGGYGASAYSNLAEVPAGTADVTYLVCQTPNCGNTKILIPPALV